jgi:hypothetical protein
MNNIAKYFIVTYLYCHILLFKPILSIVADNIYYFTHHQTLQILVSALVLLMAPLVYKLVQKRKVFTLSTIALLITVQNSIPYEMRNSYSIVIIATLSFLILKWLPLEKLYKKQKYLAFVSIIFLLNTFQILINIRSRMPQDIDLSTITFDQQIKKMEIRKDYSGDLKPNIYHFIIDHASSLHYEEYLHSIQNKLTGYIYYPNAFTNYAQTVLSIPAIIKGRVHNPNEPLMAFTSQDIPQDYLEVTKKYSSFNYDKIASKPFRQIKKMNYQIVTNDSNLSVDTKLRFKSTKLPVESITFSQRLISEVKVFVTYVIRFINPNMLDKWGIFNSSDPLSIIREYQMMENWVKFFSSTDSPTNNTYYFLYTKIPHPPYVLGENCEAELPVSFTDIKSQIKCSQVIFSKILNALKNKHKDNNYILLFHSDHGVSPNKPNPILITNAFSNQTTFQINKSQVSLTDIVPSLILRLENLDPIYPIDKVIKDTKDKSFYSLDKYNLAAGVKGEIINDPRKKNNK